MANVGRPRKEIKPDILITLAQMCCTCESMAFYFDCSIDTIQLRVKEFFGMTFEEFSKHHRQIALMGLKQKIWQKALKGDNTCLINLLKVYDEDFNKVETRGGDTRTLINFILPDQIRLIAEAALEEADEIERLELEKRSNGAIETVATVVE